MQDEPEIVRELRELEKRGELKNNLEENKPINKKTFEIDEELDDMWFSLWNCV